MSQHGLTSADGGCADCGYPIEKSEQKFCPQCGQPTPAHRIDWHFLSHEVQHSIFHVDKGILFTIKHLLTRPGHMIREYIQGKRAGHFKPVLMIMILGAVVTLLSKYVLDSSAFGGMVNIRAPSATEVTDAGFDIQGVFTMLKNVGDWMGDHFGLTTLLLVPFQAFAFKIAFKRFRNINYPEWLVIQMFLTAQVFVIYIFGIFIRKWLPGSNPYILLFAVLINILTVVQLFKDQTRWKIVLRSAWAMMLFYLMNLALMSAFVAYVVMRYKV